MRVAVLPGDGIGPEVTAEALRVLEEAARLWRAHITWDILPVGGEAIDRYGDPLPADTLVACRESDAVLLGAVGGPRWDGGPVRPEAGLLRLRKELGVYANLRPVMAVPYLSHAAPVRPEVHRRIGYTIVRELTGGLYFGPRHRGHDRAHDTLVYTRGEIARVARVAFAIAASQGVGVTLVDKANVLESSRLWRQVVGEVAAEYPEVPWETELVDSAAMHLVQDPGRYGVLLTENLFGDILSDLGAGTLGSLGLLPSASLGDREPSLYEPVHGSAPDIAGTGRANPLGAIGAVAMMLRYSLGLAAAADAVEKAIVDVLAQGARTADIAREGEPVLSTREMGDRVLQAFQARAQGKVAMPLGES